MSRKEFASQLSLSTEFEGKTSSAEVSLLEALDIFGGLEAITRESARKLSAEKAEQTRLNELRTAARAAPQTTAATATAKKPAPERPAAPLPATARYTSRNTQYQPALQDRELVQALLKKASLRSSSGKGRG